MSFIILSIILSFKSCVNYYVNILLPDANIVIDEILYVNLKDKGIENIYISYDQIILHIKNIW